MGMIGGQVIDVKNEGSRLDGESLLKMYSMKTSALIKCACEMGVICAGRDDMLPVAEEYGAVAVLERRYGLRRGGSAHAERRRKG